ncbi:DnaJ-like protein subfamily C member 16 [Leptotrombidium deliense]|uniref:DnaJ homolog subfamily C member 16 n=1 Tax=Leptotrombidium deliense TaxID=299467 RepID=A0A443SIV9_9ACAR|nr:DnaJ-like protein subfamily C member 16 [Leptotrombidium deliense]
MKMNMKYILSFVLLLSVCNCILRNPYEILGVQRRADIREIKKAYKDLVKKWHPDRNPDKTAESRFIEITKAYELLSDPQRREDYDKHGITEDTPNFRYKHDYSSFHRFDFDHFDSFFTSESGSFQFKFNTNHGTLLRKLSITTKAYENNIVPQSSKTPYLIMFYGDLCFPCFHAEPVWQKIQQELEPIGVGFATVHTQHESGLSRKIGVNGLPYIIGVVDGIVRHYKDDQLSLLRIIDFVRRILPKNLITSVNDNNYEMFLTQWSDNRIRALFVNSDNLIKLRYLLTAYYFNDRVSCGYFSLKDENKEKFLRTYNVDPKMSSLLIFNEDISRPVAVLSAPELKVQTMKDVLESNKFLLLPRLSSQLLFDQLCPTESLRIRRRLCVVLVTNNVMEHEPQRDAMRSFIREHSFNKDRIRFMYLFQEKQQEFIKALSYGAGSPESPVSHVVVLWRREQDRVLYEWLPSIWDASDPVKLNESKSSLNFLLTKLMQNTEVLPNKAQVVALIDEQSHGLFGRIVKKILIMTDGIGDNITKKEVLPVISVALSIGFVILIGYIMQHLVRVEEESIQERYRRLGKTPPGTKTKPECRLNIHELRGETYNGLVRLLKPGCRTIVLLCSNESKPKLLPIFYKCVYPYRRNKTLLFAYLMVEKNIDWYKKLLLQALIDYRDLQINPKNCIGTVISLNGFRKYFCVYHAKTTETSNILKKHRNRDDESGGAFLGFEDSTEEENSDVEAGNLIFAKNRLKAEEDALSKVLFEENLLDALPRWLERLFEGTTHRYHIQYWPEHMK